MQYFVVSTMAAGLLASSAPSFAQTVVSSAEVQAQGRWREDLAQIMVPHAGCFHADYPNLFWEETACKSALPGHTHPLPRHAAANEGQTTGNGADYAIEVSGLISSTTGTFPVVTNVRSEKGVGVAAFGGGGILGANEYSLQINSNANASTTACKGHSGCVVWQQAVYAPDYAARGEAAVFFQYWLIGYASTCPGGWGSDGAGDCYKNSSIVTAPDEPITQLGNMKMVFSASAGGKDVVTFTDGSHAYSLSASDSVLDVATVWQQAEFNVVGNAGGSRADFNKGSSVTVRVAVSDGSTATPRCANNAGTTGETNNLTRGACSAAGGATPSITFTEHN